MRKVIAFWGFKGGSGRSLLLANLAAAMSASGKRVLVIDCDLEAPGVGDYFDAPGDETFYSWREKKGILDLIVDRRREFSLPAHGKVSAEHIAEVLFNEEEGLFTSGAKVIK